MHLGFVLHTRDTFLSTLGDTKEYKLYQTMDIEG